MTPDAQGRILLPQVLVDYAGISKQAYVIGVGDYGEIWSEAAYVERTENENVLRMRQTLEQLGL